MVSDPITDWLTNERNRLARELERIERRRDDLVTQLDHYEAVLGDRLRGGAAGRRQVAPTLGFDTDELRGMTIEEAAVTIARRGDGVVDTTTARPAMVAAGIITDDRPGAKRLYNWLDGSEAFEKIGRGKYRLLTALAARQVSGDEQSDDDSITRYRPRAVGA